MPCYILDAVNYVAFLGRDNALYFAWYSGPNIGWRVETPSDGYGDSETLYYERQCYVCGSLIECDTLSETPSSEPYGICANCKSKR